MSKITLSPIRLHILTLFAVTAFSANSLLCRIALGDELIDPRSFALIRMLSGALLLSLFVRINRDHVALTRNNWASAFLLFVYMVCFAYAYMELDASTGALVLFTSVQTTLFVFAWLLGERLSWVSVIGIFLSVAGVIWLYLPSAGSPPLEGVLLMLVAGVAMGAYGIMGRKTTLPLEATARNFLLSLPFALLFSLFFIDSAYVTTAGAILAIVSGAYASGVAYVLWYDILSRMSVMQVSTAQLMVPVLATIGGISLLEESMSADMWPALLLMVGGGGVALYAQMKRTGIKSGYESH